jgi:hypothetical protein
MAQWYRDDDERDRSRRYGAWRDRWEQSPRERGMFDRGADEVRSWFGDDDAERRRQFDRRYEDDRGEGWLDRSSRRDWRDYDRDRSRARGTGESQYDWESSAPRRSSWSERGREHTQDWNTSAGRSENRSGPWSWSYTEVWMIPGPHVGRGPNGYSRSDDRIREDICDRLTQHGLIDASQVDVAVTSGEVTLRGYVPDRESKRRAEDVAESVFGVTDVRNELRTSDGRQEGARQPHDVGQASGDRSLESPLGISSGATAATSTRRTEQREKA